MVDDKVILDNLSPLRSKKQVLTKSSRVEFARCIASSPTIAMSSKLVCNKPASFLLPQSSCKELSTKFRQQPVKTLQILIKILLRIFVKPCHKDIPSFGKQETGKMI